MQVLKLFYQIPLLNNLSYLHQKEKLKKKRKQQQQQQLLLLHIPIVEMKVLSLVIHR